MLSIIIPTKNEECNISACIAALSWAAVDGVAEIIVVDNNSADSTVKLAQEAGAKVVMQGPERSAQRNRGARDAIGEYVFFVDADMRVKRETLREILEITASREPPDALFVREEIAGIGYWNSVRNFERSFYDGTCIDGLRVIRRKLFCEVGGFDEMMYACEDWDLDRRLLEFGASVRITDGALIHNEQNLSLSRSLRKKGYYAKDINKYIRKWNNDDTVRKQLGLWYRFFGVFLERGKWKRVLARPDLMLCVWVYRILIGIVYIMNRNSS